MWWKIWLITTVPKYTKKLSPYLCLKTVGKCVEIRKIMPQITFPVHCRIMANGHFCFPLPYKMHTCFYCTLVCYCSFALFVHLLINKYSPVKSSEEQRLDGTFIPAALDNDQEKWQEIRSYHGNSARQHLY